MAITLCQGHGAYLHAQDTLRTFMQAIASVDMTPLMI